jgi:hypothetical protein
VITLKIKKAGHTVDIPGLPTCRSPVDFDISKLDIRVVAMSLKNAGIAEYEIVADIGHGVKEVYTKNDFEVKDKKSKDSSEIKELNKRFKKLEGMISSLLVQKQRNSFSEKEQINNKLDRLEKLITKKSSSVEKIRFEPEIEELESFIPDIDTSSMKIKSKNLKVIKQDSEDLDDASDMLSSLMKK